jgi:hypothetical protein
MGVGFVDGVRAELVSVFGVRLLTKPCTSGCKAADGMATTPKTRALVAVIQVNLESFLELSLENLGIEIF